MKDGARFEPNGLEVVQITLSCDFEKQEMVASHSVILTLAYDLRRNDFVLSNKHVIVVSTEEHIIFDSKLF